MSAQLHQHSEARSQGFQYVNKSNDILVTYIPDYIMVYIRMYEYAFMYCAILYSVMNLQAFL
jgi:hypothetical protein